MNHHLRKFLFLIGIAGFMLVGFVFLWHTVISGELEKRYFRAIPEVKQAEIDTKVKNISATGTVLRGFLFSALGLFVFIPVVVTLGFALTHWKKSSVHQYEIGESRFFVHDRDLSIAAPVALGLTSAKQLEAVNAGTARGAEVVTGIYERLAKANVDFVEKRLVQAPAAGIPDGQPHPEQIPTFKQLLDSGELSYGKPMILGYENGVPRRGSFLDIYSAAVAGESGSGKTATLLFLMGSALVSMPVRFIGIDPHYPHPKSLAYKTKTLWDAGLMEMATYKDDMLKVLSQVERTIDRRLKQLDTDTTPVVLVIDELAFLSTTSIGANIAQTMERISMEGRKCAVYMLASSQTWLAAKTGGSSAVRDTLTSAFVHRIKPKQANLLLQDKEQAEKVKKHVKQAGEALLVPVGDESTVVKMPFTTERDMQNVVDSVKERALRASGVSVGIRSGQQVCAPNKVGKSDGRHTCAPGDARDNGGQDVCAPKAAGMSSGHQHVSAPGNAGGNCVSEEPSVLSLAERTGYLLDVGLVSYGKIQKCTGIAKSTAYNFVKRGGNLEADQVDALQAYLDRVECTDKIPA